MKKTQSVIKNCSSFFELFDEGAWTTNFLANLTNDPYHHRVSNSLEGKSLEDCGNCWARICEVAFTYGFIMGQSFNPNSKHTLKLFGNIKKMAMKADVWPMLEGR
jgi:hypothetical protein